MTLRAWILGISLMVATGAAAQEPPVRLFAAGSLRAVMTEIGQAFTAGGGPPVQATFGASGLLRERIETGERADVFASADLGNPQALAQSGRMSAPVVFTRNRLCALVAPGVSVDTGTLLERMLDPAVKLGTSTPKADPSGDYAWQLFERAERLRPGAYAALDAKALKLTGGPQSRPPPPDRSIYGVLIASREADIFLTYCTNALQAMREVAGSRMVAVPEALAVGADYGLALSVDAPQGARRFAAYVLSAPAQEILVRHGFGSVAPR